MTEQNAYPAEVRQVFSGDDLIVFIDLGVEDLWKRQRVRLHGVDTPNALNAGADTEAGKVRSYVSSLVRGKKVMLTVKERLKSAWIVDVHVEAPGGGMHNLNADLINQGYKFKR